MPAAHEWSWASTGDRGLYILRQGVEEVGTVSLLPGRIRNEGLLLDEFVDLINTRHQQPPAGR